MPIRKIESGRIITVQSSQWVGPYGTIWYDETLGDLRIGDDVTPGGRLISFGGAATDLTAVTTNILPANTLTGVLNIGSPTNPWNTLYLSSSSFVLGGNTVAVIGGGIYVNGSLVTGSIGPQGPQGVVGPSGPTGVSVTGPQGPTGATGPQGIVGPSGPSGTSVTGPQGPQGITGPTGVQGNIGPSGAIGPSGVQGPQGIQGDTGSQGPQGPTGSTGATGATGPQGVQGEQGIQGPQGIQGVTGPQGAQGDAGPQGVQGVTGPQGATGPQGIQGEQGPQGPQGVPGQSSSIFQFKANTTATVGDPGVGHLIWNSITQTSATSITLSHLTSNSLDIEYLLGFLQNNDTLRIQEAGVSENFQSWRVTGNSTVTVGSYVSVPVSLLSSSYSFTSEQDLIVVVTYPGPTGPQGPTGLTGATGATGPQGPTGADGTSVTIVGTTSTQSGLPFPYGGTTGDGYITSGDGHLWIYGSGTWTDVGTIVGPEGPSGVQGPQGPIGVQGPQGASGVSGPQGVRGLQGPQGPSGASGVQGPQGIAGPQGVQGPQGASGATGQDGPQGVTGPQGASGVSGPQGPIGATGVAGPQGVTGPQGSQGQIGPQGPQGVTGPQGASGVSGPQGPIGDTGVAGPQGVQGPQGIEGPQGVQGVQGPQGAQGNTGTTATIIIGTVTSGTFASVTNTGNQYEAVLNFVVPIGPQGPQGTAGSTGAEGPQGPTGVSGVSGPSGPQGVKGDTATLTVSLISIAGTYTNTVTNVSALRFDSDSGFDVIDLGSGNAKIQLNSTFKYWNVDGNPGLVAEGLDTVNFVASTGSQIVALTSGTNKSITFSIRPATTSSLGGIKVGSGLSITADGTLSAFGGDYNTLINKPFIPSTLNDLSDVNTSGALSGQVLKYDGSNWIPQTDLVGSGALTTIKTFNVLGRFNAPVLGKAIFVPPTADTIRSVTLTNGGGVLGNDLMVGLYRNNELLNFFTIPAGYFRQNYSGLNFYISTTDYITVSVVAGQGENFSMTLLNA